MMGSVSGELLQDQFICLGLSILSATRLSASKSDSRTAESFIIYKGIRWQYSRADTDAVEIWQIFKLGVIVWIYYQEIFLR